MFTLKRTPLLALLAVAVLAASQAKAASITFNAGDLTDAVDFNEQVAVDLVGGAFAPGPATRVFSNTPYGDLAVDNIVPVALADETIQFNFSLSRASVLYAIGAPYNDASGFVNNLGQVSLSLYNGSTLLGSNLDGNTAYILGAGTNYSFLLDTKTGAGVSLALLNAQLIPRISVVPLPPGLPMFAAAVLGLVAVARSPSQGNQLT